VAALLLAGVYFGAYNPHVKPLSHPPAIPEKSIAVLPFENLSDEKGMLISPMAYRTKSSPALQELPTSR